MARACPIASRRSGKRRCTLCRAPTPTGGSSPRRSGRPRSLRSRRCRGRVSLMRVPITSSATATDIAAITPPRFKVARPDIVVHTDAVQAFAKVPVDSWGSGTSTCCQRVCATRSTGPSRGVGALLCRRKELKLAPADAAGGHQERGQPGAGPKPLLSIARLRGRGGARSWLNRPSAGEARCDPLAEAARAACSMRPRRADLTVTVDAARRQHRSTSAFEGCPRASSLCMALDLEGFAVIDRRRLLGGNPRARRPSCSPSGRIHDAGEPRRSGFSLGPGNTEAAMWKHVPAAVLPEILRRIRAAGLARRRSPG